MDCVFDGFDRGVLCVFGAVFRAVTFAAGAAVHRGAVLLTKAGLQCWGDPGGAREGEPKERRWFVGGKSPRPKGKAL